jgi:hypothetical protein
MQIDKTRRMPVPAIIRINAVRTFPPEIALVSVFAP